MMPPGYDGAPERAPSPLEFRRRESERSIYTEKKIGDEWIALWSIDPLPADANVTHVTVIPYRGERVVLPYKDGKHSLPETDVTEGETAEDAIRRVVMAQCGILDPRITHLGHFTYKATTLNKTLPAGKMTFDALYVLEIGSLADNPGDESYERRTVLQRDLNLILRGAHIERRREYTDALDRWLLERLKAAKAQSAP
jgi:ADP-ribose pyrophosphatase YjhB (NUDIX family)